MFDRTERMLADVHPFSLFFDIFLNGDEDKGRLFWYAVERVVMVGLDGVGGDLLEGAVGRAVHAYRDIDGLYR